MKIAMLTSGFLPVVDGVTVTLLHRLQKLSQLGHTVELFCPDYRPIESVYPNWNDYVGDILPGVRVTSLESQPFMGLEFERNVSAKSYPALLRSLEAFQPDVIHVDEPDRLFLGFDKLPAVAFARHHHVPCVGFYHTNFLQYMDDYFPLPGVVLSGLKYVAKKLITQRVYNAYDATLVSSPTTYAHVVQVGITNAVNGNFLGVDLEQFHPGLRKDGFFQQHYGLDGVDRQTKLLFLGRLTPDKGWAFTLDAITHWAKTADLRSIAFLIAGDGSLRNPIAQTFSQLNLPVHLLGRINPADVPALVANSDIHVTTSEKETKGLTILEACAAGIPAIGPRAGGLIDSIQDGENGYLFTPGDRDGFLQKLTHLIDHPDLRQTMGTNGRTWVAQFSWDEAVNQLIQQWQRLILH